MDKRDPLWWKEMAGDFVVYPSTEKEVEAEARLIIFRTEGALCCG